MMTLQRPGRAAAAVGGMVAVGAATLMALLSGTASAATAGTCTDNVNVRSEPSATAEIVAVCDRGTTVQIGEKRNGFVKLENLDGWASAKYVKANADGATEGTTGTNRRTPTTTTTTPAPTTTSTAPARAGTEDADQPTTTTTRAPNNRAGDEEATPSDEGTGSDEASRTSSPARSLLGG
ncbi:MAG: SH3 domain-containing protein [Pseudonocardia sp.]|nr:SH3 domain-containing protein [Pseudonocardia sp.]